jgi:4-hydroxybenzoate polyprenyltransferase
MTPLIVESLRPKQWIKNFLLFAGLIFSENLFHLPFLLKTVLGFAVFCGLSSAVYLLNDFLDLEQDRQHPEKSKRPLASGRIPAGLVLGFSAFLFASSISASVLLGRGFAVACAGYAAMMIAYSLVLKHVIILDVIVIAVGFVVRALAGALLIHVAISPWLLVCTIFLALFFGLVKRRHERLLLGAGAGRHRKNLEGYHPALLDQMIGLTTAASVITYTLYTFSPETVAKFQTGNLILTVPFLLYGVFRYLYLIYQKGLGGSPEQIILSDLPTLLNCALYLISVILILYI